MDGRNEVLVFRAKLDNTGFSVLDQRPLTRGAVRTRGVTTGGGRDRSGRIRLEIGEVDVSIKPVHDRSRGLFTLTANASCKGRDIDVTVRIPSREGLLDSDVIALRNQVYQFMVALLPANLGVLVEAHPVEDDRRPGVEELVAITERSWKAYIENRVQSEIAWEGRVQRGDKFEEVVVVCHPDSPIKGTLKKARELTASACPVLVCGPSGAGKELLAYVIHQASRPQKPFIPVNCANLPETLLESELFGHEKGAFTGAVQMRRGRFELANGGTLFLDEVADMSASLQAKLLRVLQDKQFERLGGTRTLAVDVRVIAATNKNLSREIEEGRFRVDLYFRLGAAYLELPALEERSDDIPPLVSHYLKPSDAREVRLGEDLFKSLFWHHWPGNVRELVNLCDRLRERKLPGVVTLEDDMKGVLPATIEGLRQGFRNYESARSVILPTEDREISQDLAERIDSFLFQARESLQPGLTMPELGPLMDWFLCDFKKCLEARCGQQLASDSSETSADRLLREFYALTRSQEAEGVREGRISQVFKYVLSEMKQKKSSSREKASLGYSYALLERFLGQKFDHIRK